MPGLLMTGYAFSPVGGRFVSYGESGEVFLRDGKAGALLRHTGRVTAGAFSADGRRSRTAGEDQTIRAWDVTK